jgi:hypothetical protein
MITMISLRRIRRSKKLRIISMRRNEKKRPNRNLIVLKSKSLFKHCNIMSNTPIAVITSIHPLGVISVWNSFGDWEDKGVCVKVECNSSVHMLSCGHTVCGCTAHKRCTSKQDQKGCKWQGELPLEQLLSKKVTAMRRSSKLFLFGELKDENGIAYKASR